MEKYHKYTAIDFAEDPDFIRWVQDGFQHKNSFWIELKTSSSNISDQMEEAINMVEIFHFKEEEISKNQSEELFKRINKSIQAEEKVPLAPKPSIMRYLAPTAIAAAIAAMLIFYMPSSKTTIVETTVADQTKLILPDNSKIAINATSKLSYNSKTFKKKRYIQMEGEAFFEVEKGQTFVVETPQGQIEVLGTSFNIFDRAGIFKVHCLSGKVKVSNKDKSSFVILNPNESCSLNNNKLIKKSGVSKQANWRKGIFHFENQTLQTVFEELERQFKITILAADEIRQLNYTGFFESKDLKEALYAVCWPLRLDTKIEKQKIYIVKAKE